MEKPTPSIPPWSWADLEASLQPLAETSDQRLILRHFLSGLRQNDLIDPRAILGEVIHIAISIASLDGAFHGTGPHPAQPLSGPP